MPIGTASSFVDLADLAAFQHAKALGWSDKRVFFAVGDICCVKKNNHEKTTQNKIQE
jgi:hypothetical protein